MVTSLRHVQAALVVLSVAASVAGCLGINNLKAPGTADASNDASTSDAADGSTPDMGDASVPDATAHGDATTDDAKIGADGSGLACVPGATCAPADCQTGLITCSGDGGQCVKTANLADGTPCGSGGTSVCHAGSCGTCAGDGGCSCPPSASTSCSGTCTDTQTDSKNCGACGHDCTALSHVSGPATCSGGVCNVPPTSCAPGWMHCPGNATAGCETDISSPASCGGCTTVCPATAPKCAGSASTYSCVTGCSGSTPTQCNGSCVDTTSNSTYCGSCTTACSGGMTCQSSACKCPGALHSCSGSCVANDTNACGPSCTNCSTGAPANTTPSCNGASCSYPCSAGSMQCASGCVNTSSDPSNCGACNHSCGGAGCSGGLCLPSVYAAAGAGAPGAGTESINGLTTDGTTVYWTYTRGPGGASQLMGVVGGGTNLYNSTGNSYGAVTAVGGTLYWIGAGRMGTFELSMPTAGGTPAGGKLSPITAIADDGAEYYLTNGTNILSCSNGTTTCSTFVASATGNIVPAGAFLYWTEPSAIMRCAAGITCGGASTVSGASTPTGLAVDSTNVYWLDGGGLHQAPIGGGSPTTLVADANGVGPAGNDGAFVYWAGQNTVYRAHVGTAGAQATPIANSQFGVTNIIVDAANIYWNVSTTAIMRLPK